MEVVAKPLPSRPLVIRASSIFALDWPTLARGCESLAPVANATWAFILSHFKDRRTSLCRPLMHQTLWGRHVHGIAIESNRGAPIAPAKIRGWPLGVSATPEAPTRASGWQPITALLS